MTHQRHLSKLTKVALREVWKHEANEFTPWLAMQENLDELANTLGISELIFNETEHEVGDFTLDILCTDGEQNVIIENQLAETDHKHLGQILTYAAGIGARTVIWVAESFRPEHAAALQFLNENTTPDLNFFGVQIELWRINDSPPAPKFEVVVKPDNWTKTNRNITSLSQQIQLQFWTTMVDYLHVHASQIRPQPPHSRYWLKTAIGKGGVALNMTASMTNARLGVEIYLSSVQAKTHFSLLHTQKVEIEQILGFPLDWQELPNATTSRIVYYRYDASIEDKARWPDYMQWFAEHMTKMYRVFHPIVKELS